MTEPSLPEESLFLQALEIGPPAEQAAFLDRACGTNAELRSSIEALLRHHRQGSGFLESPPTEVVGAAEHLTTRDSDPPALDFLAPSTEAGALGRLGHYEIHEVLGCGGFGVVLKARDTKLDRIVAIKTLASSLASSATARKRFVREAKAAAAVKHENVVGIYHVSDEGPVPYLVMECVSGVSLEEKLQEVGTLDLAAILRIGVQTASGLAAAHQQGLVHRDVKPGNILLENGVERVKITDFGLARAANDAAITRTGEVAGTPQYMSPEQALGQPVDPRSDLFSLGSVLYAMCTGRSPFRAESTVAALRRVCDDTPRPIREINAEVPEWLVAIINRLLAKNPADRFQTAAEVAEVLGQHLAHLQHPPRAVGVSLPAEDLPVVREHQGANALRSPWRFWTVAAAVLLFLLVAVSLTEATGVTHFAGTVIRLATGEGVLAVEVNDPQVQVTIAGDGGLVITGAGPQEVRLQPGSYKVHADKDGKLVRLDQELVTISRGDKQVVRVRLEGGGQPDMRTQEPAAAQPAPLRLVRRFTENSVDWVNAIRFAPDGDRTVVTSDPDGIDVWNLETGAHGKRIHLPDRHLRSWAFSADGTRLVGLTRSNISSIEWPSGQVLFEQPAHETGTASVLLSNARVVTTGHDGFIRFWDARTGAKLNELPPPDDPPNRQIYSLAVAPDEQHLVVGRAGMVNLWNTASGKLVRNLAGHPFDVYTVAISPDSRHVLTGSSTGLVQLFELDIGKRVQRFEKHTAMVLSLVFLPGGRHFVSGAMDGSLRVWSLDGREVACHQSEINNVSRLAVTPDGRRVLSAGGRRGDRPEGGWLPIDATLHLWELPQSVWPHEVAEDDAATAGRSPTAAESPADEGEQTPATSVTDNGPRTTDN